MKLSDKSLKILEAIGNLQLRILYEMCSDEDYSGLIGFNFNGSFIVNPVVDESDTIYVDPIEYYGDAFLESEFMDLTFK